MCDSEEFEPNPALFQCGATVLVQRDFADSLAAAGLRAGDVCFVHSGLREFGTPKRLGRTRLLEAMAAVFMEVVGPEGTLVFPTFTYSYCDGQIFDIDRTPTKMGVLNEYFRSRPDVRRSNHPLFSVAAWGKHRDRIINVGDDSFAEDSVFGRIRDLGGKLVFFGVPFGVCTFVHCIEQALGVPYRYFKEFFGTRIVKGVAGESKCTFYVRQLDTNVTTDLGRLERELTAMGLLRCVSLGLGGIRVVEASAVFSVGMDLLRQDIFAFLREPPERGTASAAP